MTAAERRAAEADARVKSWASLDTDQRVALIFRLRSGGGLLDDGSARPLPFPDWRAAVDEAHARGLRVPDGVPPLLPAGSPWAESPI